MSSIKSTNKVAKKTITVKDTAPIIKKAKEPLPDDNEEAEDEEIKTEFETWEEVEKACKENEAEMNVCNKRRKQLDSIKKTMYSKMKKEASKGRKKKRNADGTVQNSGVTKKIGMPPKFLKFVITNTEKQLFSEEIQAVINEAAYNIDSHIARNTITKIIYDYIKYNELYETDENGNYIKKAIVPDKAITTLFALKKDDQLMFNTFQTFVSTLVKTAPEIEPEVPVKAKKVVTKVATKKVATKKKVVKKKVVEPEPEPEYEEEEEEEEEEYDEIL